MALTKSVTFVGGRPICRDSDGDGICDEDEILLGTNPFNPDTDGDGFPDGLELALGSDRSTEEHSEHQSARSIRSASFQYSKCRRPNQAG